MKKNLKDVLIDLDLLRNDINNKVYKVSDEFNNQYQYKYFTLVDDDTYQVNNEFGNSKEDFDKLFKKSALSKSLSEPQIILLMNFNNGFILKTQENSSQKKEIIQDYIDLYIDQIFFILDLNKNKKIDFENFLQDFILVSTKYSNQYDNVLLDLDLLIKDPNKIKFIIETFK